MTTRQFIFSAACFLSAACGDSGGGVGGSGGGSGAGSGGGSGGGSHGNTLTGLIWVAPDGGVTNAPQMSLLVATVPATFDAGPSVACAIFAPDGGVASRQLMATSVSGQYASAMPLTVSDGTWRLVASSGSVDASVTFEVDRTGPALTVMIPPVPSYGTMTADFLPTEDGGAFRKDEVVQVDVKSSDTDVGAVTLSARFGTSAALQLPAPTNCGAGCNRFSLDLSKVEMPAFRGDVVLTPSGSDVLGNPARFASPGTVHVSRWQWARRIGQMGGSLKGTPAIGNGGRIFVGISDGTNNGIAGVNPDGQLAWPIVLEASNFPVAGPIATGRGATTEHVFYQLSNNISTGS